MYVRAAWRCRCTRQGFLFLFRNGSLRNNPLRTEPGTLDFSTTPTAATFTLDNLYNAEKMGENVTDDATRDRFVVIRPINTFTDITIRL